MRTQIWTRITVTALALCAVALAAAPAAGQTLRRDGSKAVPFVANVSKEAPASYTGPPLRRDGSDAVPFVADVGPNAPAATDGFDWGDAGLGAAVGGLAVALAAIGAVSLGGRQTRARPTALS